MTSSMKKFQIIQALGKADLLRVSISYLRDQVSLLFKENIHTGIEISPNWGKLHRAVKYKELPLTTDRLSYPIHSNETPVSLGRANLPKKPVFYCSANPAATFFELNLQPTETVVLSTWSINDWIKIFPLGYTDETFKELCSNRECPLVIPRWERHKNELKPENKRVNDYFDRIFMVKDRQENFKLSAVIAEQFLMSDLECGLVYPTVAMRANAENFALTTQLVDKKLALESAKWFRVDKVENFSYTISCLNFADNFTDDGKIDWQGCNGRIDLC